LGVLGVDQQMHAGGLNVFPFGIDQKMRTGDLYVGHQMVSTPASRASTAALVQATEPLGSRVMKWSMWVRDASSGVAGPLDVAALLMP